MLMTLSVILISDDTVPIGNTFGPTTQICFGGDCSSIKAQNYNYRDIQIEYKFYFLYKDAIGRVLSGMETRKKSFLQILF